MEYVAGGVHGEGDCGIASLAMVMDRPYGDVRRDVPRSPNGPGTNVDDMVAYISETHQPTSHVVTCDPVLIKAHARAIVLVSTTGDEYPNHGIAYCSGVVLDPDRKGRHGLDQYHLRGCIPVRERAGAAIAIKPAPSGKFKAWWRSFLVEIGVEAGA